MSVRQPNKETARRPLAAGECQFNGRRGKMADLTVLFVTKNKNQTKNLFQLVFNSEGPKSLCGSQCVLSWGNRVQMALWVVKVTNLWYRATWRTWSHHPGSLSLFCTQGRRSATVTSTRDGCLPTSSTAPPSPLANSSYWWVACRFSAKTSSHDGTSLLQKQIITSVKLSGFKRRYFLFVAFRADFTAPSVWLRVLLARSRNEFFGASCVCDVLYCTNNQSHVSKSNFSHNMLHVHWLAGN